MAIFEIDFSTPESTLFGYGERVRRADGRKTKAHDESNTESLRLAVHFGRYAAVHGCPKAGRGRSPKGYAAIRDAALAFAGFDPETDFKGTARRAWDLGQVFCHGDFDLSDPGAFLDGLVEQGITKRTEAERKFIPKESVDPMVKLAETAHAMGYNSVDEFIAGVSKSKKFAKTLAGLVSKAEAKAEEKQAKAEAREAEKQAKAEARAHEKQLRSITKALSDAGMSDDEIIAILEAKAA